MFILTNNPIRSSSTWHQMIERHYFPSLIYGLAYLRKLDSVLGNLQRARTSICTVLMLVQSSLAGVWLGLVTILPPPNLISGNVLYLSSI